jgi:hypothetical protein
MMALDRWDVIPVGNTPASIGMSEAMFTAWNGACAYKRALYMGHEGHGDGSGSNAVHKLDFNLPTPIWSRLRGPSVVSGGDDTKNGTGVYADGRPRSTHTYMGWAAWRDKLYLTHLGAMRPVSTGFSWWTSAAFKFPLLTLDWVALGRARTGVSTTDSDLTQSSSAVDPIEGYIWVTPRAAAEGQLPTYWAIDTRTDTFIVYDIAGGSSFGPNWSVVHPHKRLLIIGGLFGLAIVNLRRPQDGFVYRPTSGVNCLPTNLGDRTPGAVYDARSNGGHGSVLLWDNDGAAIRALDIPADPYTGTFVGRTIAAASGGSNPNPAQTNGTYNRFNMVEWGDERMLVLVNSLTSPVYGWRMRAGGY